MAASKALEAAREFFLRRLKSTGMAPTNAEVAAYLRRKELKLSPGESMADLLSGTRLAKFSRKTARPAAHRTAAVPRKGVIEADFGFLNKFSAKSKASNRGCIGFLLAVERTTGRIYAEAVRNSKGETAAAFVPRMAVALGARTLLTDSDSAFRSSKFRAACHDARVRHVLLRESRKVSVAEAYVGILKKSLSLAKQARGTDEWRSLLPKAVAEVNSRPPTPTYDRPRSAIRTAKAFDDLVAHKLGSKEVASAFFNSSNLDYWSLPEMERSKLFAFSPGEPVLVSNRVLRSMSYRERPRGTHPKPSEKGSFSEKEFVVTAARIVPTAKNRLVDGSEKASASASA